MSIAAQGAFATSAESVPDPATGPSHGSSAHSGLEPLDHGAILRGAGDPPLPDDGDPTPEARSLAVTQAMVIVLALIHTGIAGAAALLELD